MQQDAKINLLKPVVSLYTNINKYTKKLRTIIPFKIASIPTVRESLELCLTKKVKGLYNQNSKAPKKEAKYTRQQKDCPCS